MSDNTPGVEAIMRLAYDYAQCADWALPVEGEKEAQRVLREAVQTLVESRDALLVKCDGLEGHYQELDYMLDDVKAERDAAIAAMDKHCACEIADDGQITAQCGAHKAITDERDAAIAKLATKCGCVLANVSDGPHPELAAKDRMYAIEVCWYHEFVHKERDALQGVLSMEYQIRQEHVSRLNALTAQNAELREAAIWQWKINHGEHCTHDLNADDVCLADQEGSTGCCWPKPDCIVGRLEAQ